MMKYYAELKCFVNAVFGMLVYFLLMALMLCPFIGGF